MRIMVMFDLPVTTKSGRKAAARFRNFLLKDGYYMIQYSVYGRVCNGNDAVQKHTQRLNQNLPANGSVKCLTITERQYESINVLVGTLSNEEKPFDSEQSSIF